MFPLLPYKTISFDTFLTVDEVASTLSQALSASGSLLELLFNTKTEFVGRVSREGFRIRRRIMFLSKSSCGEPIVYGKFIPTENGTRIDVRIIMSPFGIVGYIILCIAAAFIAYIAISSWRALSVVIYIWMLLISYFIFFAGFWYAANKAEQFLNNVFRDK